MEAAEQCWLLRCEVEEGGREGRSRREEGEHGGRGGSPRRNGNGVTVYKQCNIHRYLVCGVMLRNTRGSASRKNRMRCDGGPKME
jgi:hypothetical protein